MGVVEDEEKKVENKTYTGTFKNVETIKGVSQQDISASLRLWPDGSWRNRPRDSSIA